MKWIMNNGDDEYENGNNVMHCTDSAVQQSNATWCFFPNAYRSFLYAWSYDNLIIIIMLFFVLFCSTPRSCSLSGIRTSMLDIHVGFKHHSRRSLCLGCHVYISGDKGSQMKTWKTRNKAGETRDGWLGKEISSWLLDSCPAGNTSKYT